MGQSCTKSDAIKETTMKIMMMGTASRECGSLVTQCVLRMGGGITRTKA